MSEVVSTHQPCNDCGSSDALSTYDDGHTHCFSCGVTAGARKNGMTTATAKPKKDLLPPGEIVPLNARKIYEETCAKFGYTRSTYAGKTVQIAPYHDASGALVGQKIRFPDKTFTVVGSLENATLFGARLWRDGGKRVVVTEGEIDALSYAQVTSLKWATVSVPNGAQGAKKAIKKNLEWLEKFDEVVFMFDMDEPGRKAARECAELLRPGKAKVAELPLKDANEMLQQGRVKDLMVAVWEARGHRPDGIVNASELWDEVSKPVEMGTPYPWAGFNDLLYGARGGEIVTLSAGSGVGKSAVCAEWAYHLGQTLKQTVGYIGLEENVKRSAMRFMGIHQNMPLHLPGYVTTPEATRLAFEETLGTGRYYFYDHFGTMDSDNLLDKLRYLVIGCDCRWLVLDHLSIVVSGIDADDDERRAIDRTMTRLRSFTEETGAGLFLVSHLKRPDGNRGHEQGAQTSLSQLRGSQAIAQLSDIVIGLERDQQDNDEDLRNLTTIRVLKNRYAGLTGIATKLRYDRDTGRLTEERDNAPRKEDFDASTPRWDGDGGSDF